jgi:hypothetical protein
MNVQSIEASSDQHALLFAFFIEGPFDVDDWIGAAGSSAGVTKNVQVHDSRMLLSGTQIYACCRF